MVKEIINYSNNYTFGDSKHEIDQLPTNFLLDEYKMKKKSNIYIKTFEYLAYTALALSFVYMMNNMDYLKKYDLSDKNKVSLENKLLK